LFHGAAEGMPGLAIDRFASVDIISHRAQHAGDLAEIAAVLTDTAASSAIIARAPGEPPIALRGAAPPSLDVREGELRFRIWPYSRWHPGLYLDARPARRWILAHSHGRRVLNLFSFTGSLGVAAAIGGAREVIHVDRMAESLEACRANHALNGVPVDDRALVRVNVYQQLRKRATARQSFDAILIDAPPLPPRALRSDRTPGGRGMWPLLSTASAMLAPDGWLLCFLHQDARQKEQIEREVRAAVAPTVELTPLWWGESGDDFPAGPTAPKLRFAAFQRN
jgi:23S rRNA (cytosine1962-C5)-methyltransferase